MIRKIICVLLVVIMVIALASCGYSEKENARFKLVSVEKGSHRTGLGFYKEAIFVDRETGVLYIAVKGPRQFAISVLLDADGTPMLYEETK